QITQTFFEYLATEIPLDQALQKAQQDWINQAESFRCHPYYWAGYVLIGKGDPIQRGGPASGWIGGLILIGICLFVFWERQRMKGGKES
ncbi:MAG: CHAT domain-containing protein, partial [Bacteroidota bacterium]